MAKTPVKKTVPSKGANKAAIIKAKMRGEGPFGSAQTALLKFIFNHPKCSQLEIKEACFNDKSQGYVHNILSENIDLIKTTSFDSNAIPSQYQLRIPALAEKINLKVLIETNIFESI